MKTFLAQNQFINPAADMPVSSGQAVASNQPPLPDAAAEPLHPADPVSAEMERAAVIEPASPVMAAVISPVTMAPINVIGHNPVTHAVEVRPQVSPVASGDTTADSECRLQNVARPDETSRERPATNHIAEIFVGARRLPPAALPPDMQALLDAIENDQIWADEAPLFLRSPTE